MGSKMSALDKCKAYMRVEHAEEDALIASLMDAAEIYLMEAGAQRTGENSSLYDLAVWSLTLHYYDHRDAVGSEAPIPTGLRPILNQLKLTGMVFRALE